MNWFLIFSYFKYLKQAVPLKKNRCNSAFVQELVSYVFTEKHRYYHFDKIDQIRKLLLESDEKVEVTDLGAGSKKFGGKQRKVSDLVKFNSTPQKQGELISKLVTFFKPDNIIELGTSLGLGTLYFAMPNIKAKVFSIEGCPRISRVAKETFHKAGVKNIELINGSFDDELSKVIERLDEVQMVYFDGHHDYGATLNYFNRCLPKSTAKTVFVFDDIRWSKGMEKAWGVIVQHPSVTFSFDFFRYGIAILNMDESKQSYVVK